MEETSRNPPPLLEAEEELWKQKSNKNQCFFLPPSPVNPCASHSHWKEFSTSNLESTFPCNLYPLPALRTHHQFHSKWPLFAAVPVLNIQLKGSKRADWRIAGEQKGDMTLKEEEQEAKEGLRKGYLYEGKGCAEVSLGTTVKIWGTTAEMQWVSKMRGKKEQMHAENTWRCQSAACNTGNSDGVKDLDLVRDIHVHVFPEAVPAFPSDYFCDLEMPLCFLILQLTYPSLQGSDNIAITRAWVCLNKKLQDHRWRYKLLSHWDGFHIQTYAHVLRWPYISVTTHT